MWKPTRTPLFWARFYMYSFLFKLHYHLPSNYHFLKPGLEIQKALEEAEKQEIRTYFLGPELNQRTWERLYHETRMNLPHYLYQRFVYLQYNRWWYEKKDQVAKIHQCEPSQYAEKVLDPRTLNWFIQNTAIFFPQFKRIFVDLRDDDLFKMIDNVPERRIVVVVNQWHMEGIEHNWATRYGQQPRSVTF